MSTEDIELGPIDYLVVEWPAGKEPNGEGLKHLVDLSDRGLIRVIDLAFMKKNDDGSIEGMAITDLDADGSLDLVEFEGASSGLLGDDEYEDASEVLAHGNISVALLDVVELRDFPTRFVVHPITSVIASARRSTGADARL